MMMGVTYFTRLTCCKFILGVFGVCPVREASGTAPLPPPPVASAIMCYSNAFLAANLFSPSIFCSIFCKVRGYKNGADLTIRVYGANLRNKNGD